MMLRLRALLLAALIAGLVEGLSAQPGPSPPNIIIIVADDHNASVLGVEGDARARTPNLDRLASSGVRFRRAYCNSPDDNPARAALLTARLPHSVAVTTGGVALREKQMTLADYFAYRGYVTALFGDMRFLENEKHGFAHSLTPRDLNKNRFPRGTITIPPPLDPSVPIQPMAQPFRDRAEVWLNAANLPLGATADMMTAAVLAKKAAEFMAEERSGPFLLLLALGLPRAPHLFPVDMKSPRAEATDFDPPSPAAGEEGSTPIYYLDLTPDQKRGILAAYHNSVAYLDDCAGTILEALDRLKLRENTIIVYTSDSGAMLGEHGFFETQSLYEPAIRVPLLVSWPKRFAGGRISEALVEQIDLLPTLADAAGLPPPPRVEGRSFLPALLGTSATAREYVFSELLENEEATIRGDRLKLVYGTGKRDRRDGFRAGEPPGERQLRLYDLTDDPGELRNIATDSRFQPEIARMKQEMHDRFLAVQPEGFQLPGPASMEDILDLFLVPRHLWPGPALLAEIGARLNKQGKSWKAPPEEATPAPTRTP